MPEQQQYLDLRTGKTSTVHPHMKEVVVLREQQGQRCREILQSRVAPLQEYGAKLKCGLIEHQSALCRRLALMKGLSV